MKTWRWHEMKWILSIFVVILIVIGGYFYVEFNGLPWKRYTVANELKEYIEKKYTIKTSIKDRYYNFKNGGYGVQLYETEKGENFSFTVVKVGETIEDYYPEHVWSWQINDDINPIVEKYMTNVDKHTSHPIHGTGYDNNGVVPHYKETKGISLTYNIFLKEVNEEVLLTELFNVIEEMKGKEILNVELYVSTLSLETNFTSIDIPEGEIEKIKKKEDILNYKF
jgi:hypothetical protein